MTTLDLGAPCAVLPPGPDAVSEVQRQFLIAETVTPDRPPHLQHCVCLMPPDFDEGRLRRAIALLDGVHDAMRLRFERGEEWHVYRRRVLAEGGLELECQDCTEDARTLLRALRQEDRLDRLHPPIAAFGPRPLARATLLHSSDARVLLVLSVHHLAFDGLSAAIYCRHLVDLYVAADPAREAAALRARVVPYTQFIRDQHVQLFGAGRAALHAFWREALRDLDIDRTPLAPATVAAPPACRRSFPVAPALARRVAAFAAERALTPHLVLMACLQWAVHSVRGDRDLLTLTPTRNRPPAFAETLGCFMNPVVVRQRIDPGAPVDEVLRRLRVTASAAYRHSALPIGHVVRELCPELLAAQVPLWRTWFGIQVPTVSFPLPDRAQVELHSLPQGRTAGKGLSIELVADGDGYEGLLLANASMPQAPRVLERFLHLAEQLPRQPGVRLGDLLETLV